MIPLADCGKIQRGHRHAGGQPLPRRAVPFHEFIGLSGVLVLPIESTVPVQKSWFG